MHRPAFAGGSIDCRDGPHRLEPVAEGDRGLPTLPDRCREIAPLRDVARHAARIDGAGEGWIFLRVVLPLMRGPLGALSVLAFFQAWTAFAWPLVVVTNKDTYTLEVGLALFQTGFTVDLGRLSAAASLALIPSVVFFSIMRRNFVRGIAAGGLKE